MSHHAEAVRKSIRAYLIVGAILFLGTIFTVAVATVPALDIGEHGFDAWDAVLGLGIATIKVSLVAAVFMHLNHERKAVYWIFGSSLVFVVALFGLTALAKSNPIHDSFFYGNQSTAPAPLASPVLR